jgi:hypothetical protein
MKNISYEQIAPLVTHHEIRGRQVLVKFTCPVSGMEIQSSAHVHKEQSMSNSITNSAQRSIAYGIQNAVSQVVRDVFGYNLFGRVAGDVARQTVRQVTSHTTNKLSSQEVQKGILASFESVYSKFTWDGTRYISAQQGPTHIPLFTQQLIAFPIVNQYDKRVLARLMTEMIVSDGDVGIEETYLFNSLIDPELGTFEDYKDNAPLSLQELQSVSSGGIRKTMLMVVWAMALCDEYFDETERRLLHYYAKGLKIDGSDLRNVQEGAQDFILQQYLSRVYGTGMTKQKRDVYIFFAQKLGVSKDVALTAEVNYQKQMT